MWVPYTVNGTHRTDKVAKKSTNYGYGSWTIAVVPLNACVTKKKKKKKNKTKTWKATSESKPHIRVRLDRTYFAETENWKHYNKIIFKCVNNTVRTIFNEKIVEKWNLWDSWIIHWYTINGRLGQPLRSKKRKKQKA